MLSNLHVENFLLWRAGWNCEIFRDSCCHVLPGCGAKACRDEYLSTRRDNALPSVPNTNTIPPPYCSTYKATVLSTYVCKCQSKWATYCFVCFQKIQFQGKSPRTNLAVVPCGFTLCSVTGQGFFSVARNAETLTGWFFVFLCNHWRPSLFCLRNWNSVFVFGDSEKYSSAILQAVNWTKTTTDLCVENVTPTVEFASVKHFRKANNKPNHLKSFIISTDFELFVPTWREWMNFKASYVIFTAALLERKAA